MDVSIFVIAGLLVLSAFFSGSETALTGASKPVMHELERQGDSRAELVNRLLTKQDRLIGAILLGNNLVNILASVLATTVFLGLFGNEGVVYATIVMTLLVLIFAEILPKTYALLKADQTALRVAPWMRPLVWVLAPITGAIQILVRAILRLVGIRRGYDTAHLSHIAALRGAIELHQGASEQVQHERAMLRSILDLADVDVEEVMTHRKNMVMVDADLPIDEIVKQVLDSPYSRLPLFQGSPDNIVGTLHAKALLRAVGANAAAKKKLDVAALANEPWFVPEYTSLFDQLQAFRDRREHFALVVDEYGALLGVVTLEDILEEIVGDIVDEHDITAAQIRRQKDGSVVVDGTVTIRDLNREFDWSLPDVEASTIAGLVLHESRRIPEVGQKFMFHGFRFEILRRQRHQITLLRIRPPKSQQPRAEKPARAAD